MTVVVLGRGLVLLLELRGLMCHLCSLPAHDAFITLVCHLFNSREGHFLPAFSLWDVFLKFPLLLFILSRSELHGLK